MRSRSGFVVVAALLALVAVAGVATEAVFVHTDDGCAVEQHCTACRVAIGGVAVEGSPISLAASLDKAEAVAPAVLPAPREDVAPDAPSRAPPLT